MARKILCIIHGNSIFLDVKVCGFNSVCVYNRVITSWYDICDIEIWATSILNLNKYFELKNSWGANGAPQTRTTC